MTTTEAALRRALFACHALLAEQKGQLQCTSIDEALSQAERALALEVTPMPVFIVSGKFVRGPSRPEGSGIKEMVFQLPCTKTARMTANNLNSLFARFFPQQANT